jgi:hypothetical protein
MPGSDLKIRSLAAVAGPKLTPFLGADGADARGSGVGGFPFTGVLTSVFCILYSVFCILYSVFSLLGATVPS